MTAAEACGLAGAALGCAGLLAFIQAGKWSLRCARVLRRAKAEKRQAERARKVARELWFAAAEIKSGRACR